LIVYGQLATGKEIENLLLLVAPRNCLVNILLLLCAVHLYSGAGGGKTFTCWCHERVRREGW